MGATEIILVVIGVVIFLLGYLMPAKKKDVDEEVQLISEDEVRKLVAAEVEHVKDKIADIVEETVSYSIEKTERAMERLTNEKIMAINEYSDTVLEEINKNHKEVVFLYDMLNDKHDNLMSTVNEATVASEEIKQALRDTEAAAKEAANRVEDVLRSVDEASGRITDVLRTADDAVKGVWDAQNAARVAREAAQEAIRIATEVAEGRSIDMSQTGQNGQEKNVDDLQQTQDKAVDKGLAPALDSTIVDHAVNSVEVDNRDVQNSSQDEENEWITAADFSADVAKEDDTVELNTAKEPEFKPIAAKKVEVIYEPEEDDTADDDGNMTTSAAFASMGIFAPKTEDEQASKWFGRLKKGLGSDRNSMERNTEESASVVDIQFANSPDNGRNSNERILELHKAGKTNMAIAKELGLGLGEVKLVIDLFEGV